MHVRAGNYEKPPRHLRDCVQAHMRDSHLARTPPPAGGECVHAGGRWWDGCGSPRRFMDRCRSAGRGSPRNRDDYTAEARLLGATRGPVGRTSKNQTYRAEHRHPRRRRYRLSDFFAIQERGRAGALDACRTGRIRNSGVGERTMPDASSPNTPLPGRSRCRRRVTAYFG